MKDVLKYFEENKNRYLAELSDFIAIPSVSTNPENRKDVQRCAKWVAAHLKGIGMRGVRIFPTKGHPIVYAEWLGAPGAPTVLMYGHYDVQPVDPVNLWNSPPFRATVRGGKIYARGSADDKGQVFSIIKAFDWQRRNDTFYYGLGEVFPGIIPPVVAEFDIEICVPLGTPPGTYRFQVQVLCSGAVVAAQHGFVDEVIAPRQTRAKLITALAALETKRDRNPPKKHGNIPL